MINEIEFENREKLASYTKSLYLDFQKISHKKRKKIRDEFKNENLDIYFKLKDSLTEIYNRGFGLKLIARNLNITYMICRSLFEFLEVQIRRGQNVTTDELRKFRKSKAIYENLNNTGFNNDSIVRKAKRDNRGMQGYIWNNHFKKFIWIRSSYEYIYAKWLNKNNFKWEYDYESYKLEDETTYRPDFFIFNERNEIDIIVEIKGYWDNRLYKVELLKKIKPDIKISVIGSKDINSYIEVKSNFDLEKRKWNLERKLNKITKELNDLQKC